MTVHADDIAERATALGGLTLGTVRMSAANSQLPECDLEMTDSLPIVEALADWYAEDRGDADTADLCTQVSRDLDKALWFLEAHLQTPC